MSTYRKKHFTKHRNGWRYNRRVPSDLVPLVGTKFWTKYLGIISYSEAEVASRKLDVAHDEAIARLKALTPAERAELVFAFNTLKPKERAQLVRGSGAAGGGVAAMERTANALAYSLPFVEGPAVHLKESDIDVYRDPEDAIEQFKLIRESREDGKALRAEIQAKRALVAKAKGGQSSKIANLIPLWKRVAAPRSRKSEQRMHLYVKRFVEVVGDMEPRAVRREHAISFRDALEVRGTTKVNTKQQLEHLHRLFSVALSENLVEQNPFSGVKLRKDAAAKFSDEGRRRPFNGEQVKAILAAAEKLDTDRRWILRLLAFHGARSGEICQLRPQDVTTASGIPILRITDEGGSLKNKFSRRDVPIHPECLDIVAYANARSSQLRLFGEFSKAKDSAAVFQHWASQFLRQTLGITDGALTTHSLRHAWRTAAREIDMPEPVSRAIMGHSMGTDDHAAYGSGPSLRKQAEWMAKIDPTIA